MTSKRGFLLALAASASISAICPAFAEVYPARPITVVVPFPAGGPMDTVGRILAESMRASLGKPLTIENVTGAGGTIGVGRVACGGTDVFEISLIQPEIVLIFEDTGLRLSLATGKVG